jgi:hypothetical protein
MGTIDLEIQGQKFDKVSVDFYAQNLAESLAENPFDFYREKGESLHWYFAVIFIVSFAAFLAQIIPSIAALIIAVAPGYFAGVYAAAPLVFLLNVRGLNKCRKTAAKMKQPVFITAHGQDDDTVFERWEFAMSVMNDAWPDDEIRPRPVTLYFLPGDDGRCWQEYRSHVDQVKVEAFRAYHREVKAANPEYYESEILGQRNRPWQKIAV